MYPIYYNGQECGRAVIEKMGLYCRIICKCEAVVNKPCKIWLQTRSGDISLGTCIKTGNFFYIDTKVPCKHIDIENIQFNLILNTACNSAVIYPVDEEAPFPHLYKLDKARMRTGGGKIGVIFID